MSTNDTWLHIENFHLLRDLILWGNKVPASSFKYNIHPYKGLAALGFLSNATTDDNCLKLLANLDINRLQQL